MDTELQTGLCYRKSYGLKLGNGIGHLKQKG
jgi:hypothetical protein